MKLHVCLTNSPGTESLLRILNIAQLIKKFPAMLARTRHWILFWARWTQSISSHHISLRKILILPSHRRVKLQSGARIFLKDFATKMLYELLISLPPPPSRGAYPAHLILHNLIKYKLWTANLLLLYTLSKFQWTDLYHVKMYRANVRNYCRVYMVYLTSENILKVLDICITWNMKNNLVIYRQKFGNIFQTGVNDRVPTQSPVQWVQGAIFPRIKPAVTWSWQGLRLE